jgi:GntR family transcriptional repressor for pyruvate dehydrogenase complex
MHLKGLRAGDRLPSEHELTRLTGAGRSSVREALQLLIGWGLIEAHPGKGYYVAAPLTAPTPAARRSLEIAELQDLTEARLVLECECAALAAIRATPDDILRIEAHLHAMEAKAASSPSIYLDTIAMHLMIGEASHNATLKEMLHLILPRLAAHGAEIAVEIPNRAQLDVSLHKDLWAPIRARNPEAAREAMAAHIRDAMSLYMLPYEFQTLGKNRTRLSVRR